MKKKTPRQRQIERMDKKEKTMYEKTPVPFQPEEANQAISITTAMIAEVKRARDQFALFSSPHEALGVLYEEYNEVKDEIFKHVVDRQKLQIEAVQLGAMCIRLILDCCIQPLNNKGGNRNGKGN